MIKYSNVEARTHHNAIKNTIKSGWIGLLILFPVGVYIFFYIYNRELLDFLLPYLPHEPDKSQAFYIDLLHLAFSELLWISGFLLLTWIFGAYLPLEKIVAGMECRMLKTPGLFATMFTGISFCLAVFVSYYTLQKFPNSADEYVYVYQGETLSKGKLWEKSHELSDFFYTNHITQKNSIRVGRFPPGWPAFIGVGIWLGIPPYLINPILGLTTLVFFYILARKFFAQRVALWSLFLLSLSPFYVFNAASFFSHLSCALAALIFVFGVYLYRQHKSLIYLIISGCALGIMITIRYYTALIIFLPFFFFLFYQYRWRSIPVFFWIAMGSAPFVAAGFWYNFTITGSPFLPVTVWGYADEALGFVKGHTFSKGVEHVLRWMLMFLYWSSPALLILYLFFLWNKLKTPIRQIAHPEDYVFVLLVAGYFFYYEIGGNQYGPRFFFEAFPFVVLFVVRKVIESHNRWLTALFCAGLLYSVAKMPFIVMREHRVVVQRSDLYNQVKSKNIHHAVILISSHTGLIRPMPAGDLTRNDADYQGDVLFALDLGELNKELMNYYPERSFYKYEKPPEAVEGNLVRIK